MAKMAFCPFCKIEHEAKWIIHRPIGSTCIIDWNNGCREMASKLKNSDTYIQQRDANFDKVFGKK